ncbi:hypothetical protein Ddc_19614 [Ditylenchus destructor]|nr:hypothetical protein Ddc_19614 [Ditylenchus destructor]
MEKAISSPSVKRSGSPIADGSGSEAKKRSPEKVEVLDDPWLEALKFLTCSKWSKMRLVTRKLSGLVRRNVSRLPLAIVGNATVRKLLNEWKPRLDWSIWNNGLPQFLQILYDQSTFIKDVRIHIYQPDLSSTFTADDSRHIRCGKLMLRGFVENVDNLREYISWIEQNLRADQIHFRSILVNQFNDEAQVQALNILSDFCFGSSHMCANEEAKFELPHSSVRFLNILISKFRTISVIDSRIPTIVIYPHPCAEIYRDHLGANLIDRESDKPLGTEAAYLISNGDNRMRISFCKSAHNWEGQSAKFDVYVKFYTV